MAQKRKDSDPVPVQDVIEDLIGVQEHIFTKENARDKQAASRISLTKNNVEKKIIKLVE